MEQRNMILAFALSILILFGWSILFPPSEQQPQPEKTAMEQSQAPADVPVEEPSPAAEMKAPAAASSMKPAATKAIKGEAVTIGNDLVTIDINDRGWLTGARLAKYRDSQAPDSKPVSVLVQNEPHALYISAGIINAKPATPFGIVTNETANGTTRLVMQTTLTDGRIWRRSYTLKPGSYLLEVEDQVAGGADTGLYQQVVERYPNKEKTSFYEHAGPIGLASKEGGMELHEITYEDLDKSGRVQYASVGGWIGMMDRYFIASIYGDQQKDYRYYYKGDGRTYQAGMIYDATVDKGMASFKSSIFIGPKSFPVMKALGVGMERSVDFGWFAFISKPLHDALIWLYQYIPNYGWCIILLVLAIKIIFFYPTQKSYQSMAAMRRIQPEQKRLQELYGGDRQRLGQEMMALYKKHKVNPLGGCLPILIQIPVFFALYKVLLMSIEMRHAPFIGWITDLSAQDPFYILPLLMGASMYIQQKLNPQPPDPMQAKLFQFMPIVFTVMFLFFPAGLVLYWVVNNVLSIIQQRLVMRKMGVE